MHLHMSFVVLNVPKNFFAAKVPRIDDPNAPNTTTENGGTAAPAPKAPRIKDPNSQ